MRGGAVGSARKTGSAIAIAMYLSGAVERYLHPMVRILMAVPVVSWILFAVLWFPGVEFRIGFVLVVVCGPVFLVDTLDAMRSWKLATPDLLQVQLEDVMSDFDGALGAIFKHVAFSDDQCAQAVELDLSAFAGRVPVELLGNTRFPRIGEWPYLLTLGPRGFFWFQLQDPADDE